MPILERTPQLEHQTLLLHLERAFREQEWYRRKRTLQLRVEQWRALRGPAPVEMFLKEHWAGELGLSDFRLLMAEPFPIAGEWGPEYRLFDF